MRPDDDRQAREVAPEAPADILDGSDDALGTGEESAEELAPPDDVERPLRRALRQAGPASRLVGLAAVAAVAVDELVLRAERKVVVQRAVVGNPGRARQLEHRLRQPVDVVEVEAGRRTATAAAPPAPRRPRAGRSTAPARRRGDGSATWSPPAGSRWKTSQRSAISAARSSTWRRTPPPQPCATMTIAGRAAAAQRASASRWADSGRAAGNFKIGVQRARDRPGPPF